VAFANRSVIAAASVVAGLTDAGAQQPVFRGGSDTVRVFVTVTDGDGRIATPEEARNRSWGVGDGV